MVVKLGAFGINQLGGVAQPSLTFVSEDYLLQLEQTMLEPIVDPVNPTGQIFFRIIRVGSLRCIKFRFDQIEKDIGRDRQRGIMIDL